MTRLMCSKDRTEVEFVRKELFRAGIRSEIRSNPVAAALRVSRLELWVQDERDFLTASKLCDALQRDGKRPDPVEPSVVALPAVAQLPASIETDSHAARPRRHEQITEVDVTEPAETSLPANGDGDIEQAGVWLEKEIEELLDRETKLSESCASLQQEIAGIKESLSQAQSQASREIEGRQTAEKKLAEFLSRHSSLENELAHRTRSEEQMQRQLKEMQAQVRPREEALLAAQSKLEVKNREVQAQQASLSKLHAEVSSRDAQVEKLRDGLSQVRAELAQERERRIAAEERADKLASRQTALEEQLVHHTRLQQELQRELQEEQKQLRGYAGTLNNLRQKLQANRPARPSSDGNHR